MVALGWVGAVVNVDRAGATCEAVIADAGVGLDAVYASALVATGVGGRAVVNVGARLAVCRQGKARIAGAFVAAWSIGARVLAR